MRVVRLVARELSAHVRYKMGRPVSLKYLPCGGPDIPGFRVPMHAVINKKSHFFPLEGWFWGVFVGRHREAPVRPDPKRLAGAWPKLTGARPWSGGANCRIGDHLHLERSSPCPGPWPRPLAIEDGVFVAAFLESRTLDQGGTGAGVRRLCLTAVTNAAGHASPGQLEFVSTTNPAPLARGRTWRSAISDPSWGAARVALAAQAIRQLEPPRKPRNPAAAGGQRAYQAFRAGVLASGLVAPPLFLLWITAVAFPDAVLALPFLLVAAVIFGRPLLVHHSRQLRGLLGCVSRHPCRGSGSPTRRRFRPEACIGERA